MVGLGDVVTTVLFSATVADDDAEAAEVTLADTLLAIGIIICVVGFIWPSVDGFWVATLVNVFPVVCGTCCWTVIIWCVPPPLLETWVCCWICNCCWEPSWISCGLNRNGADDCVAAVEERGINPWSCCWGCCEFTRFDVGTTANELVPIGAYETEVLGALMLLETVANGVAERDKTVPLDVEPLLIVEMGS